MEEAYINWIDARLMSKRFKDDRQTIMVMPQGLKKMPKSDMWPKTSKGDFWFIDGQHNVQASKKNRADG